MTYLDACLIVRAEKPVYLEEWITHYLSLGVDRVWLYDNAIDSPIASEYPKTTIIRWPGDAQQIPVYNDCRNRSGAYWLAFFDADEFINLRAPGDLRTFLSGFEDAAGLVVFQSTPSIKGGRI